VASDIDPTSSASRTSDPASEDMTLRRLAELDSAPWLTGRVLLAEADGVPLAAVSLETGAVAADPFRHTAHLIRMLRLRRCQLMRQGGRRPLRALLRRSRADAYRTA
jgi:hypothetical protein